MFHDIVDLRTNKMFFFFFPRKSNYYLSSHYWIPYFNSGFSTLQFTLSHNLSVENRRFLKRLIAFHLLIWVVSTSRLLIDIDIQSKSGRCSETFDWFKIDVEMELNCSFIDRSKMSDRNVLITKIDLFTEDTITNFDQYVIVSRKELTTLSMGCRSKSNVSRYTIQIPSKFTNTRYFPSEKLR